MPKKVSTDKSTSNNWSEAKLLNLLLYASMCHPDNLSLELKTEISNYLRDKNLELNENSIRNLLEIIDKKYSEKENS